MENYNDTYDMSDTFIEHTMIINNFVIKVGSQIKDCLCRVLGDSAQYQWRENDYKYVIPDVSINCNTRDRKNVAFTGVPRFVMEVLSESTENYDRVEKNGALQKSRGVRILACRLEKKASGNISF